MKESDGSSVGEELCVNALDFIGNGKVLRVVRDIFADWGETQMERCATVECEKYSRTPMD